MLANRGADKMHSVAAGISEAGALRFMQGKCYLNLYIPSFH
jgi:hypothetical protein